MNRFDEEEPGGRTLAFERLKNTLSKLYPIETYEFTAEPSHSYPMAPRFCWKFYRPDLEGYKRFVDAVLSYRGKVRWIFGPQVREQICIIAVVPELMSGSSPTSPFVGYPPGFVPSLHENPPNFISPNEEFIGQTLVDLPVFIEFIENSLALRGVAQKHFDPKIASPQDPPSENAPLIDFIEPGTHVTWIVRPQSPAGGGNAADRERIMLHFSVTADEWRAIYLIANITGPTRKPTRIPLLSTISANESVSLDSSEVEELREECLRARANTSSSKAIRGLDKIILICLWAKSYGGGVFLAGG